MSRRGAGRCRAIVQRGYNAAHPESTLELVWKPIPTAAPGHVVVHITIRPVHPTDLLTIRAGKIANTELSPGAEGFGIVEEIGRGVTLVKPGQRVVPLLWHRVTAGSGSWQEFVSLREEFIIPVPDSISDETAAQFIINPWTVIGMLDEQDVPKGDCLIQTAAGSVLGRLVIQLAKHLGFKTINIVRRPEQKEELFALGADEVICSKTEDVVARVKDITSGRLAWGALECVGGVLTKTVVASVRKHGQVFIHGILGSAEATIGLPDILRGVEIKNWLVSTRWDQREYFTAQTMKYLEDKILEPLCGDMFDLAFFRKAIEKNDQVGRGGKVFLTSY